MSTTKTAVKVVAIGAIGASLLFFGPFVLAILGEILCGGVIVFDGLVETIGEVRTALLAALIAGIPLAYVVVRSVRFARKKISDPAAQNTDMSTQAQNARYIQKARAEGMQDEEIRGIFRKGGWSEDLINTTFARAGARI